MSQLLNEVLGSLFVALLSFAVPLFLICGTIVYTKVKRYKQSQYYVQTGHRYTKVLQDTGLYGEYRCVAEIEARRLAPLILTNLYLPHPTKRDRTTEIDVLFIDESGVHVIESKNYSGWIFGREQEQQWTQTLSNRKKFKFYNPVKQNELHMRAIEQLLGLDRSCLHSWIVFSDRSTLKRVESSSVPVLNRKAWAKQMTDSVESRLSAAERINLYEQLRPYMHVSDEVKAAHIDAIQQTKSPIG
ncbi:nuclease-related domain-containing protein [Exiguobacterium sp. s141]|uniref:nuclease-related domain-containing protein n=1 Tax=Exiguobacterium sp. s141 TaxID=2751240 RepID=UPI001BEB4AA2|nr:nuclease-related domain-containing protein [Exiguobacterium sp. s141]